MFVSFYLCGGIPIMYKIFTHNGITTYCNNIP
uniref:Uncharacterized protein n=1 Tax=Siphoviridae sp. ct75s2 TaxID=2825348 RepID=A0A8S5Q1I0_9CAUD|nr:MAG TPA: hypothetical protein [Siphoviridae sp. ct75s2]